MKLSGEQLASLVRGAVRFCEKDGWLSLERFTEKQTEAYRATGNLDFVAKTHASAGMRIAVRTDSRRLSFAYRHRKASSRPFAWFDLYEDEVMTGRFGADEIPDGQEGIAEFALDRGKKLVEIYLPWSHSTELRDFELDDGATFGPVFRDRKLLAYGDSITQGYDAIHPSLAYTEQFAAMIGADVTNKAIAADYFFPPLLDGEDLAPPDLITIAYGTNDWSRRTRESTEGRARAFLEKCASLYRKTPILVISPIWRADWKDFQGRAFQEPATEIDPLLRSAAKGIENVTVLCGWPFVPHLPGFYADRSLHPNDLGFGSYGRNLYLAVEKTGLLHQAP